MGILSDVALGNLGAIIGQAQISAAGNTDEQALKVPTLYPDWADLEEDPLWLPGRGSTIRARCIKSSRPIRYRQAGRRQMPIPCLPKF